MKAIFCEQGTAEWFAARCGRVTGSRVKDMLDRTKAGKDGANRTSYRLQLLAERMTGERADGYVTHEMQWGIDNEPLARAAYEMAKDTEVERVGFVVHESIQWFGASPDGLVDEDGALEIKCPKSSTHLKWMLAGEVPEEHQDQMLAEMACTGRKWVDFVSYDPRMPEGLQLFIVRFHRDDARIAAMEREVLQFIAELETMAANLIKPATNTPGVDASPGPAPEPEQEALERPAPPPGDGAHAGAGPDPLPL